MTPPPSLEVSEELDGFTVTLPAVELDILQGVLGTLLYGVSIFIYGGLFLTITLAISVLVGASFAPYGPVATFLAVVLAMASVCAGLILGVQLGASVAEEWSGLFSSSLSHAQPTVSVHGRLLTVRSWRGTQSVGLCDVRSVLVRDGMLCAELEDGQRRPLLRAAEDEHTRWLLWTLRGLLEATQGGSADDIPAGVQIMRTRLGQPTRPG